MKSKHCIGEKLLPAGRGEFGGTDCLVSELVPGRGCPGGKTFPVEPGREGPELGGPIESREVWEMF